MQFLMALALRMGRTLGELRQTMAVGEFRMWAEYDRISPIGDIRGDILNAQLVSAVYGAQGGKVTIEDAQLQSVSYKQQTQPTKLECRSLSSPNH